MPAYMTAPPALSPRRGLQENLPGYSAGSFPLGSSPAHFFVTSVAVAANVVTLGVRQDQGTVLAATATPNVNVTGTVVGGSPVNVASTPLTGVSLNAQGVGTIQYSATTGNLATTPDGGQVYVIAADVGEALAVGKYQQFAIPPSAGPETVEGRVITWAWGTPSVPTTIALQLEAAIDDVDAQYVIVGTSQSTTSGSVVGNVPLTMRFARINVTATTGGTNPTLWAKLLI